MFDAIQIFDELIVVGFSRRQLKITYEIQGSGLFGLNLLYGLVVYKQIALIVENLVAGSPDNAFDEENALVLRKFKDNNFTLFRLGKFCQPGFGKRNSQAID